MRVLAVGCLSLSLFTGCAGPMTPFGALSIFAGGSGTPEPDANPQVGLTKRGPRLRFTPDRQVLHAAANFAMIIEDPDGVPDEFRVKVSYNGRDVTDQFMAHAEWTNLDPLGHEVRLSTKFLRLLPTRENKIKIAYWRTPLAVPVRAQYLPPVCSAFTTNQMVFSIPQFEPPLEILQLINQQASRRHLNPFFVTALVAQESAFDPLALSRSRALGLTQVTSLGESEVVKRGGDWPRYPGLDTLSLPLLKLLILNGRIHSGNEWRLDPARSIAGGVEYIDYLTEYWNRPDKRIQLERHFGPSETALSEVILASYNSGAARVSEALESNGTHYLEDEDLGEAKRYVRRVVSYCDHFEHQEE